MKANVTYNDLLGTSAADTSDGLAKFHGEGLEGIASYFNLDKSRFKIIGISIYGTTSFSISLICIDKKMSKDNKNYVVSMSIDTGKDNILGNLFKRLNVVLHDQFDSNNQKIIIDQEVLYSDFH